ncbi:MAG: isochorismatase family protein [Alicyclobacillus macrosporangiidus]|uniref:isochorismatase family protein n=1 Tax=Alicyclobacillus macrosporangiidus TaxID=392015 RepID=UPI0026EB1F16|nr:isochorismatase family protein [Alicyclobacillus macrosporangiidus]MCL6600779.1 isochorismatase family protein [Alicyclobacillus macrosporangiidus]
MLRAEDVRRQDGQKAGADYSRWIGGIPMFEAFDGFGGSSGTGERPCVLVIDFIHGFTDPTCPLGARLDDEVSNTRRLLDVCRDHATPVVFTTVAYDSPEREGGYFVHKIPALKLLTSGSKWVEVDRRLNRTNDEPLIVKKFASAFYGTPLHSFLVSWRVDTLVVTGCTTSGCVRATVVDGLQYGYRVLVPRECVGDRSRSAHEANLYDIQTKYADVVSLDQVLLYIQSVDINH